ncbi:MAG TPA: hypothetical protein VFB79_12425, partial [Candidatus Angelobacter sp.]|nr:hypothetical protein [Candidatus Angelobacter sp.]
MALLLAGGFEDPNLIALANAAKNADVELVDLRLPASESPAFCWTPGDAPQVSGSKINAAGAFIRYDVFGGMKDPRPEVSARASAWYQIVWGWLLSDQNIRLFNR